MFASKALVWSISVLHFMNTIRLSQNYQQNSLPISNIENVANKADFRLSTDNQDITTG